MGRQLVVKDIRVRGHDGVADFDCPAVRIERGTDQPEYRHPWRHRQYPRLSLRRHPRSDFLCEPLQGVPEFFKAGIDSPGPGVGVCDRSSVRYFGWKIRGGGFNRGPIKRIASTPNNYRSRVVKSLTYFRRDCHLVDLNQVNVRYRASLF